VDQVTTTDDKPKFFKKKFQNQSRMPVKHIILIKLKKETTEEQFNEIASAIKALGGIEGGKTKCE
jgi:hypothetical protein